ncbi:MAG: hypothetical protein ABIT82_10120 [Ramlibacter sp.]
MKTIIRSFFGRAAAAPAAAAPAAHSVLSSEMTGSDIESYYLRIIGECLRRMMIAPESIEIGVRRSGAGPDGLSGFAGYVRILRWDPVMTPVLLQNLSVIDARIRKVVAASVILEHTHFGGLWFQATSETDGAPRSLVGMPSELVHQPGSTTGL